MSKSSDKPNAVPEFYDELLNSAKIADELLDKLEALTSPIEDVDVAHKDIKQERERKKAEIYEKRKQIKDDFFRKRYRT
jgi:hypothetical protein